MKSIKEMTDTEYCMFLAMNNNDHDLLAYYFSTSWEHYEYLKTVPFEQLKEIAEKWLA